jgi:hypothetical protein
MIPSFCKQRSMSRFFNTVSYAYGNSRTTMEKQRGPLLKQWPREFNEYVVRSVATAAAAATATSAD